MNRDENTAPPPCKHCYMPHFLCTFLCNSKHQHSNCYFRVQYEALSPRVLLMCQVRRQSAPNRHMLATLLQLHGSWFGVQQRDSPNRFSVAHQTQRWHFVRGRAVTGTSCCCMDYMGHPNVMISVFASVLHARVKCSREMKKHLTFTDEL